MFEKVEGAFTQELANSPDDYPWDPLGSSHGSGNEAGSLPFTTASST